MTKFAIRMALPLVLALTLPACNNDTSPASPNGTTVATNNLGSGHSGGADLYRPDANAAWFEILKPVKYCISWDPSFGVDMKTVDQEFQKAAHRWADYIGQWNINQLSQAPPGYGISTDFQNQGNCDGKEDLKIFAGVSNSETNYDLSLLTHPVAFANRAAHDLGQAWGHGYIWLSPPFKQGSQQLNWTEPFSLQGALLHELGHVLGNEHIEGTIMDQNIATSIIIDSDAMPEPADSSLRERLLTQINQNRVLSSSGDLYRHLIYRGYIGRNADLSDSEKTIFKRFTGRDEVGALQAMAQYLDAANLRITYTDAIGPASINVTVIENEDGEMPGSRRSFAMYEQVACPQCPQGQGLLSSFTSSSGDSTLGVVKTAAGENVTVHIAFNGASSPLRVGLPEGNVITSLFLANCAEMGGSVAAQ